MHGYMGKILTVNLTKAVVSEILIEPAIASSFIGGSGYAARLLYDYLDSNVHPLAPENPLLFMTGPLTGTLAPCTGRHVVCSRSPLTGQWGEANAGGHFGAKLKSSGFDGILIVGRASSPKYLHLSEGACSIEDATNLWGKTTDIVQHELRDAISKAEFAVIGPAGENLVRFASIVNDERVAARCGMGTIMGSKNLKAIAVEGILRPSIHDEDSFRDLALSTAKELRKNQTTLSEQGTAMYVQRGMIANDMPVKYFQETEFDVDSIDGDALRRLLTRRYACHSCPIGCGRVISLEEAGLDGIAGPEYQTIAAFGTNLKMSDLKEISVMNLLCNSLGMDTISCGSMVAFATHLCELGRLDWNLEWNDPERTRSLIEDIAYRRGPGNELAEGSLRFASKYGVENLALQVNGLEIPNHDPRAFVGLGLVYAVSARGASHTEADMHTVDVGVDVPQLGIHASDRLANAGKGVTVAKCQDFRAFHDSLIMCHFPEVPPDVLVKLLNYGTGSAFCTQDILMVGSRIVNTKRLFNLRCGLKVENEKLPPPLLKPLDGSIPGGIVPDMSAMMNEYYQYREWDVNTGKPSSNKLRELDLKMHGD
ncbi:aldehyde ferredoxin oxidoreductase [Candidatus Thorarchaeota archaeon]|nr:MAG: aldehyde ferredoxin oxidoreductase [Candidatus Thorarchaeota archaeon]